MSEALSAQKSSLHKICENTGFHWPLFSRIRTEILSLYWKIRVSENPYSRIFYTVLGVIKDSVSYELWLPGSVELVEEDTGASCLWNFQKDLYGKYYVNCKQMPGKMKTMRLNLSKLTLSKLFFNGFWQ